MSDASRRDDARRWLRGAVEAATSVVNAGTHATVTSSETYKTLSCVPDLGRSKTLIGRSRLLELLRPPREYPQGHNIRNHAQVYESPGVRHRGL